MSDAPAAGAPAAPSEKKRGLGCFFKALVSVGGLAAFLLVATLFSLCSGGFDSRKVKIEAVKQAESVLSCALAGDGACAQAGSVWDEATLERSMKWARWIHERLGKRLNAKVVDDSWSWRHSFGTGASWHISFRMKSEYEHASGVIESFSLSGDEGELKVVGFRVDHVSLIPE